MEEAEDVEVSFPPDMVLFAMPARISGEADLFIDALSDFSLRLLAALPGLLPPSITPDD